MSDFVPGKVISGLVLLIVGVLIVYLKGDIPPNFSTFMQTLYSAFVVGHVSQSISDAVIASKQTGSSNDKT